MQMNLAEFLHKIKPAIINESDLVSESFSEKVIHESKKAGIVKSLNKTVTVGIEENGKKTVTLNLVTATALLEETMELVKKCKNYESELEKRDSIIQ